MLAIDPYQRLVYEGSSSSGIAVWPSPFISIATFFPSDVDTSILPESADLGYARMIFREDSFDPVTRVRRGRFYNRSDGSQPHNWSVQQHPAFYEELGQRNHQGFLQKQLYGFHDWAVRAHLKNDKQRTLALGTRASMTLWRVIGIEQISTGEDLVTLKARSNMGVLPEVRSDQIAETSRERVLQCIDKLTDTAYRAGPESVIDRARDMAAAVLGAYFDAVEPGATHKELGDLAKVASRERKYVLEHAARLLALLHARVKPSEQSRRNVVPPREEDAALALECAGTILREVNWVV